MQCKGRAAKGWRNYRVSLDFLCTKTVARSTAAWWVVQRRGRVCPGGTQLACGSEISRRRTLSYKPAL